MLAMMTVGLAAPAAARPFAGEPADMAGQEAVGPLAKPMLAAVDGQGRRTYIVQLADAPLASYRGGVADIKATSPRATGAASLDVEAPASVRYLAYLDNRQERTLATMARTLGRGLDVTHHYRYAYNGLALRLTDDEAVEVGALPGVVHIEPAVIEPLATDEGPELIGAFSIWDGSATGGLPGTKGEGIVAGIIDTGINTRHPSFAAEGSDGYTHTNPRGKYLGWCDPDNPNYDPELACNDKLIGLWSFPDASMDPEDEDGHGSHTSSTVAGNILPIQAPTITLDRTISGVAPHANVIMYDACAGGGCNSAATTAAIDQATADGVDVINYSISIGQNSPWVNSRLVAFKGAYEAGVFVAASAGNATNPATVNAHAPWITSVAATTHGRSYANSLVNLTGGASAQGDLAGGGMTAAYGPAPIVYAKGYLKADGFSDDGQCLDPFPADTFDGEIVVCDRGSIGRVEKGANVLAGGAGGFVLANAQSNGNSVAPDPHVLPAVHLGYDNGRALKAWLADGSDHQATISGATATVNPSQVDRMANFSSRGPARTGICCRRPGMDPDRAWFDLLKPDIGGPGVSILAAVAHDDTATTPELGFLSGTSMSSPHLAGAGALMSALHPDWTPAQIQSALMLTARNDLLKTTDGSEPASPFDSGSGRVDLRRAAETGLVLDVPSGDFDAADPDQGGEPSTLNLASLADAWCFDTCGWEREVQSTLDEPATWTATVAPWPGQTELPSGLSVAVSPTEFSLGAGATQVLTVSADASGLDLDVWAFAQIVLTAADGAAPEAHLPVVVRRVDRRLPPAAIVWTDQRLGEQLTPGFQLPAASQLVAEPFGLVRGTAQTEQVAPDPTNGNPYDDPTTNWVIMRTVSANTVRLVAETSASTAPDVDLYVGRDENNDGLPQEAEQVCSSGRESWDELCEVSDPEPGSWWIMAVNFTGSGADTDAITLVDGLVPRTDEDNLSVSVPPSVGAGEPFEVTVSWRLTEILPGDRWFGAFELRDGSTRLGTVAVDIVGETEAPPPTPTPSPTATPTIIFDWSPVYLPAAEKPEE